MAIVLTIEEMLAQTLKEIEEMPTGKYNYKIPAFKSDYIPEGCAACGGPYPDCTSYCSLFDE